MVARYDETLASVDLQTQVIDDDPEALDDPRHPSRTPEHLGLLPWGPKSDENQASKRT
jgi:hypothetical protein